MTPAILGKKPRITAYSAARRMTRGSKTRERTIAAVILVCGLGFSGGLTFSVGGTSITLTALAIAAIAGILLNAVLPGNDYEFGSNPSGDQNRGIHQ